MKKGYRKLQGVVGILLIAAAVGGIWLWENYGREEFLYTDVVVLREDVGENTIIEPEMLDYMKMEISKIRPSYILTPGDIVGMAARHFVPRATVLVEDYFDIAELVLSDEQYIFSVPNSWIMAYPQTLRRKDTAYFYPVKDNYDGGEPEEAAICSATVAYAKNTANQEVESIDNERLTGTSNVSMVEIVSEMDTVNKMKQYAENGYKFVILYQ